MAEYIKDETGIDSELLESSGGVFEVVANGQLIFSKKKQNRFPDDEEIMAGLAPFMSK